MSNSLHLDPYGQLQNVDSRSQAFDSIMFMGYEAHYLCGSRASCYIDACAQSKTSGLKISNPDHVYVIECDWVVLS